MQKLMIVLAACLGMNGLLSAQNSIKLNQQSTSFFYAQLNLHTGISNPGSGVQFGLPGRGTGNQVSLQMFKVHQPLLQKGYTPLIALDSWKVRTTVGYSQSTTTFDLPIVTPNGPGGGRPGDGGPQEPPALAGTTTNSHLNLNLQDAWVKFKTKWDRTTFKVGYAPLSYGHNPEVDANASFMTNLVSNDLGFSRDLGMYFKTPLSRGLDLEFGVSSGGAVNSTLFQTNSVEADTDAGADANGRFLVAGRIGSPSFKKNEFGLLVAVGRINANFGEDPTMEVKRIGGEWIYKFRERFKVTNQLVLGQTNTASLGNFTSLSLQNNLDFFVRPQWIMGVSNSLNLQNSQSDQADYLHSTLAASLTYAVSPHTRIRLNNFVQPKLYDGSSNWGISLQFVTGLGKR